MVWNKTGPQDTFATPDVLRANVQLSRMAEYVMSPPENLFLCIKPLSKLTLQDTFPSKIVVLPDVLGNRLGADSSLYTPFFNVSSSLTIRIAVESSLGSPNTSSEYLRWSSGHDFRLSRYISIKTGVRFPVGELLFLAF